MKMINISLSILGIMYPFIIYFFNKYVWILLLILSLLWLSKFIALKNNERDININKVHNYKYVAIFQSYFSLFNSKNMALLLFSIFFIMFFVRIMGKKYDVIIYLYPIFIYISLFIAFIHNIKEKPIVEQFAEMEHKIRNLPTLNKKEKKYTRKLTYIWSVYFLLNIFICLFLLTLDNKAYWLLYTGIIGYFLIGLLFISEKLLRNKIISIIK